MVFSGNILANCAPCSNNRPSLNLDLPYQTKTQVGGYGKIAIKAPTYTVTEKSLDVVLTTVW
jgi:hypothetical protein